MEFPTIDKFVKDVAEKALDEFIYEGKTIREWIEIIVKQQPCDDCISRADILDAIETWDKFGINAEQKLIRWQDHYVPYVHLDDVRNAIANMPSVTPSIPDVENEFNIGYNCGYTDAMIDIAESEEAE